MSKSQNNNELIKENPNLLMLRTQHLVFEVFGGINAENYYSFRIMLRTSHNRAMYRNHVDLYNSEQMNLYARKVAEKTGIHISKVLEGLDELTLHLEEYIHQVRSTTNSTIEDDSILLDEARTKASKSMLEDKNLLVTLNTLIDKCGIIGNDNERILLFLSMLSRKTQSGLHTLIHTQSHALMNQMVELLPPEDVIQITHLSENALYYMSDEQLRNKVFVIEDTIKNRKHLHPLLTLQSKNELIRTTVRKNEIGELETIQKHVQGNISIVISTKHSDELKEYSTNAITIKEEVGEGIESKLVDYQRKKYAGLINYAQQNQCLELLRDIQRVLSPISILNPFALELQLPPQLKNKTITTIQYLQLIEIIAFVNQFNKEKKVDTTTGEEYIEVSNEDILQSNQLFESVFITESDTLNIPTRTYFEKLKKELKTRGLDTFTNQSASVLLNIPVSSVKRFNTLLIQNGKVSDTGEGNRRMGFEYTIINENEYKQIVSAVKLNLSESSSKFNVAQSGIELLKPKHSNDLEQVAQKSTKGKAKQVDNVTKKVA